MGSSQGSGAGENDVNSCEEQDGVRAGCVHVSDMVSERMPPFICE